MADRSSSFGAKLDVNISKESDRHEVDIRDNCDSKTDTKFLDYHNGHFTAYSKEQVVDCPDQKPAEKQDQSKTNEYFMDHQTESKSAPEAQGKPETPTESHSHTESESR
jgi:hypothetical protein